MWTGPAIGSSLCRASGPDLGWVKTTAAKGLAAANSPSPFGNTSNNAVFFDGPDHVIAARRLKPALAANKGAERQLIQPDATDGGQGGKTRNDLPQGHVAKFSAIRRRSESKFARGYCYWRCSSRFAWQFSSSMQPVTSESAQILPRPPSAAERQNQIRLASRCRRAERLRESAASSDCEQPLCRRSCRCLIRVASAANRFPRH